VDLGADKGIVGLPGLVQDARCVRVCTLVSVLNRGRFLQLMRCNCILPPKSKAWQF